MHKRSLSALFFCLVSLCWQPHVHAEKRTDLGVGMLIGGGFQDGGKGGTFTADGPIVASEDMRGLVVLPALSIRKFFNMKTRRAFLDLSLETQFFLSNMIWKIVQGAQNDILHIPISMGAQLGIWFFRGPVRLCIAPGFLTNINIFIGGGDGGIAFELQMGMRIGVEYVIPSKFFGVEFYIWPYGAIGLFGGQNSRHNTVPAGSGGGAGMMFAIAFHFYGTKNL